MPGLAGSSCRSKAVVLTAFSSSPVTRASLSVKVSAMRNSTWRPWSSASRIGKLRYSMGELGRQRARHDYGEDMAQCAVVPDCAISFACKSTPKIVADDVVVFQDRLCVIDLV